jgi:hypothetical protein
MTGGARPSATGGARARWAKRGRQPAGPRQAEGGEAVCVGEPRVHGWISAVGLENKNGPEMG